MGSSFSSQVVIRFQVGSRSTSDLPTAWVEKAVFHPWERYRVGQSIAGHTLGGPKWRGVCNNQPIMTEIAAKYIEYTEP